MSLFEVLSGGLLTTVQDLGRKGYQKYGLPVSGATDHFAHRIANILVCNDENAAALEVLIFGLKLKVLKQTVIAITGGDLRPYVNSKPSPMWKSLAVNEGDIIEFKGTNTGCRAYIAVSGGVDVHSVLGSRSTDVIGNIGGIDGRALKRGDIIHKVDRELNEKKIHRRRIPPELIPEYLPKVTVRVVLGPQDDAFTKEGIQTLFSSKYTVSTDSDRMACRLEGPKIKRCKPADILSEGMFSGAIQVPKNGLPILFQTGRPSVGGYTKIGGVITVDLPKVAQLKPGDTIRFEKTSLEEAHNLLRKEEKLFNLLKASF